MQVTARGSRTPLPPLSVQYADYSHWQRRWLVGDALQAQLDYWKARLAGAPAALELPSGRPRPAMPSYAGGTAKLNLGAELSNELRALAKRHDVTLYMVLYAGWAVLLSRLSGQHDIVIGAPVANRQRVVRTWKRRNPP